jgi:alkylhydroperoxidase family enzyme
MGDGLGADDDVDDETDPQEQAALALIDHVTFLQ